MASPNLTILDCTLRDGGYYNEWDFPKAMALDLVNALRQSGVKIIELGYRSRAVDNFYGIFKYCKESQLEEFRSIQDVQFAFMIDVKEFLRQGAVDFPALDSAIPPRSESLFAWARMATTEDLMPQAVQICGHLKTRGYDTSLNIMGLSLIPEDRVVDLIRSAPADQVDVLYFADSYGNFREADVEHNVALFKKHFSGNVGFHAHDNLGLAFSNTLAAMRAGADFLDATVAGMGRGAGNLRTEQLLLSLYYHHNMQNLDPFALLEIVTDQFAELRKHHQWGWDFSYMLSGLQNMHANYCQKLRSTHQYTSRQVTDILQTIPESTRGRFNGKVLLEAIDKVVYGKDGSIGPILEAPLYEPSEADTVLVVAKGAYCRRHLEGLHTFIKQTNPIIIECNNTGYLNPFARRLAVLNPVRLAEILAGGDLEHITEIVTSFPGVSRQLWHTLERSLPCHFQAGAFEVSATEAVLPNHLVGSFALALAFLMRPKQVLLAGFDGFDIADPAASSSDNSEMNSMLQLAVAFGAKRNCRVESILPTRYDIPKRSVYGALTF